MSAGDEKEARRAKVLQLIECHLGKRGYRWTKQREAILEAFLDAPAHVSIDQLYDAIREEHPEIGPATLYRSMNLFVQAGVAKEGRFNEGKARFEPAFDIDHHDHLICTVCGDIQEFEDPRIENLQEEIARQRGFKVGSHRMELYGVCPKCLRE